MKGEKRKGGRGKEEEGRVKSRVKRNERRERGERKDIRGKREEK